MLNVHQPFSLSAFASRWIADGTDAGTRTVSKEGEEEEEEEGVRGHGNVTSCRQTLICRPYYHIRGVSPLPFLPFFFFSSSGRAQWLSFSWKTSSKVTSCFDELFRSLFFFFFFFTSSVVHVIATSEAVFLAWCIWSFFFLIPLWLGASRGRFMARWF